MSEKFCLTPLIVLVEAAVAAGCGILTAIVMEYDFCVRDPAYIGIALLLVVGFMSALLGVWR